MTLLELERLICRDPAGRGILSASPGIGLSSGGLQAAARDIATNATSVGIVTGFNVPDADPPAAETDGIAGSLVLADVLAALGIDSFLITDEPCEPAIRTATRLAGLRQGTLEVCPLDNVECAMWRTEFWAGRGRRVSHLIAIERAGPNHTPESLAEAAPGDAALLERYCEAVPPSAWGRCHNMRGVDIHDVTAELHMLFDARPRPGLRTIGIGDGGNEIGMGNLPWPQLSAAIPSDHACRIACRTRTDWTIVAGVSDWGAFALAAAVCLFRENTCSLSSWTADRIEHLLAATVSQGPAVDGITRRQEPTVDGLPFITYIQPWLHICRQLGVAPR